MTKGSRFKSKFTIRFEFQFKLLFCHHRRSSLQKRSTDLWFYDSTHFSSNFERQATLKSNFKQFLHQVFKQMCVHFTVKISHCRLQLLNAVCRFWLQPTIVLIIDLCFCVESMNVRKYWKNFPLQLSRVKCWVETILVRF